MRCEIRQAMELVDDAIGKLSTGFSAIGELLPRGLPESAPGVEIHAQVGKVVTALQFQDMVDQLLCHALVRLDALERKLEAAGTLARAPAPGRARPRAVAQRRMDAGELELF